MFSRVLGRRMINAFARSQTQVQSMRPTVSSRFFSAEAAEVDEDVIPEDPASTIHPADQVPIEKDESLSAADQLAKETEKTPPNPDYYGEPLPIPEASADGATPASGKVERIADEIVTLSFLEIVQLMEVLQNRLGLAGVDLYAGGFGGGGGGGGGAGGDGAAAVEEEAVVEKSEFDIELVSFDAKAKIKIIKEVRGLAELGLKEAKETVEGAPKIIKTGVPKAEAEEIAEKLKGLGAEIVLK